ncbi:MAG: DNA polymerase III subunit beta [Bacteroidaceae bacterium]|nr:DNA polymerase III subunit beta [Bacteroidaceae bacterium]MBO7589091.1 DNA polymerase III subunit beta [Bacteroidaceae bacterium]
MNFTVSSSALTSRLQAISRVINPKPVYPILDDFLFRIEEGKLTVTAADNDTTLETLIDLVECGGDGQLALPAKTLLDALKEIPEQPLKFTVNANTFETAIEYQNGEYRLMGQNADEYPTPAVLQSDPVSLTIKASILSDGLTRTIFATADDELRPVMNGIYFDINDEGATFVASDGHKLVCSRNATLQTEGKSSFILPKKPASLFRSLIGKDVETVTIEFDSRIARFSLPEFRMVCRLIDGRYPNYASVIPQNNPHHLTIDRQTFINALRRVSVFSPASSGLIKLRIQESQISISTQDIDFSTSANETLTCQYDGIPMSIGFKANFLIDILNNIPSQEIVLQLADPSRAGVIVPAEQAQDENLLMLLMPMVLND